VKNTDIKKLGKDISKHVEKITNVIEHSKGCIIFDQGAIYCSKPERIVNAIMNILILSENPEGFIPYYDGGNNQGVYDMGATFQHLPGYAMISDLASVRKFEKLWKTTLPKKGKNYHEMLDGGVKALYLTEPVPEKKLRNIEFLILQDIYPSKIMDKADVVLPACAFTEESGTVTSFERRVQKITKTVEAPGLAKPDWKIICDLAKKMVANGFDYKSHQNIFREIKEAVPFISGTGVWIFKDTQPKLFPLSIGEKINELPPTHLRYHYRGADIIERVDDFRLQIEKGGA